MIDFNGVTKVYMYHGHCNIYVYHTNQIEIHLRFHRTELDNKIIKLLYPLDINETYLEDIVLFYIDFPNYIEIYNAIQ